MRTSYRNDCIFLLKEIDIKEITIEEKEEMISKGINYSEMISKEEKPSTNIMDIFFNMLSESKKEIAKFVSIISEKIYSEKKNDLVIVSLARAGTPIGILIKKYLKQKYNVDIPHYSISIIRGKGIDKNALNHILKNYPQSNIQFVDGWTGKGSITKELQSSINEYNRENKRGIDYNLAVLIDPAKLCTIYGTRVDFGLASSCLNSTVSGLVSRTIVNEKYIEEFDFHGGKYLEYLEDLDVSNYFIDEVRREFENIKEEKLKFEPIEKEYAKNIALKIQKEFEVKDINKIKLSVGETARVLLRRNPRIILVRDIESKEIKHIVKLAEEKNVEIKEYDCGEYNCISIIKE
ncbi:cysteine protease StiP domain-containing protein [uncultured Clostridium sp.]|uniref:cysteine protease StiP domain-containing protein n=1 Tax=uncultured Clostridium sp. TaxID=59620 RepID=UPI002639F994|nr:cysteine protease StiP domain-containing protein [uncultured Clostridium sp.]